MGKVQAIGLTIPGRITVYGHSSGQPLSDYPAPGPVLMRENGFTVENVCNRALALFKSDHA